MNYTELTKSLKLLILDGSVKQKKGIHFICASMIIWTLIIIIFNLDMSQFSRNVLACWCSGLLMPSALLFSKIFHIDFQNKGNPLTKLGIIFAVNQVLYILIAMWVFYSAPDKFIMVYAIIMGAHFLPYGWLYNSNTYYGFAVIIAVVSLLIGLNFSSVFVAAGVLTMECVMLAFLVRENYVVRKFAQLGNYLIEKG